MKTRTCTKCNLNKSLSDFYKPQKNGKIAHWCKQCHILAVIQRQRDRKTKAVNYKGGKCTICGYSKCQTAMDFHHPNPNEKDFGISKNSHINWEKTKKELDKCVLLCRNCHSEIHVGITKLPKLE